MAYMQVVDVRRDEPAFVVDLSRRRKRCHIGAVSTSPTPSRPEARFELLPGVDVMKLPLTAEEGFLLSRLMGRQSSLADLTRETGLPAPQVKTLVESLVRKGAARPTTTTATAPTATRAKPVKDPYEGMIFSPADMADGRELTEEQKKRILLVEAHLDDWNHYRLLDVKRTGSAADIKTGYFKVSKEFHPDTFFRKDIGKYAERVDRIFRAMKAAYDVLSKAPVRAAYDETLIGEITPEELEELAQIADVKRREIEHKARLERADAARKAARLRRNPIAEKLLKAREYFRLAEESRKANRLDEAATHARMACVYDESLKIRVEPLLLEADAARAATLVKKVNVALQYGDRSLEEEMLKLADQAADLAEALKRVPLLIEVATVLTKLPRGARAFRLASQASELDDKSIPAWRIIAETTAQEQKWALCARAAERWAVLEPTSPRPKELLKLAKAGRPK